LLLIETPDGNLAKGMRQLNGVYTQRFNQAHNRIGHVFQGRYKAILVQKDTYYEAFRSGSYCMREIGDHVGLHYSRVSKIISLSELARGKT
jgi:hypothetical protein